MNHDIIYNVKVKNYSIGITPFYQEALGWCAKCYASPTSLYKVTNGKQSLVRTFQPSIKFPKELQNNPRVAQR